MSRVTYSASPPAQSKKYITRSKSFVRKKTKKVFGGDLCEFYIGFITDDEWKNAAYPVYG